MKPFENSKILSKNIKNMSLKSGFILIIISDDTPVIINLKESLRLKSTHLL